MIINTLVRNVAFSELTQCAIIMINIISYDGIVSRCENAATRLNLLGGFFPAHNRVYLRANQALDVDRFLAGARAPC